MKKLLNNKKGFTMIELIIVIAIIVILAAIAIPTFSGFVDNANETAAVSEARNVYMAGKVEMVDDDIKNQASDATTVSGNAAGAANVSASNITDASCTDAGEFNFTYTNHGKTVRVENGVITVVGSGSGSGAGTTPTATPAATPTATPDATATPTPTPEATPTPTPVPTPPTKDPNFSVWNYTYTGMFGGTNNVTFSSWDEIRNHKASAWDTSKKDYTVWSNLNAAQKADATAAGFNSSNW